MLVILTTFWLIGFCPLPKEDILKEAHCFLDVPIEDNQIVTEEDLKYCPGQKLKNQNIQVENLVDNGQVWRVGSNRWNLEEEKKYQEWIHKDLNQKIFKELGIETDCADAVMMIRAIYARIYNLPFVINDGTFSNFDKKFKNDDYVAVYNPANWKNDYWRDIRFQKATKQWRNSVCTANLHQMTYPVKIFDENSPHLLAPSISNGAIILSEHHSETIKFDSASYVPIKAISSTTPLEVRTLNYESIAKNDSPLKGRNIGTGILWWNWHVNCYGNFKQVPDKKMPYYSQEQYTLSMDLATLLNQTYNETFFKNLTKEELIKLIDKETSLLMDEIENKIRFRKKYTTQGLEFCQKNGIDNFYDCFIDNGKAPNPQSGNFEKTNYQQFVKENNLDGKENMMDLSTYFKAKNPEFEKMYFDYSTPGRDNKIFSKFYLLQSLALQAGPEYLEAIHKKLLQEKIVVEHIQTNFFHFLTSTPDLVSSQPWDTLEKKWGIENMKKRKKYYEEQDPVIRKYLNSKDENELKKLEHIFEVYEYKVLRSDLSH